MHCTVSVRGRDRQIHTLEVEAASLFDAVEQTVQQWAPLWWYRHQAVAEVRAGKRCWRVSLEPVWAWCGGRERMQEKNMTISTEQMAEIQAAIRDCPVGNFTVYYPSTEPARWANVRFVVHTDANHEQPLIPAMHCFEGEEPVFTVIDPRGIVVDEATNNVIYSPRFWENDLTPKTREWLKQHPDWGIPGCEKDWKQARRAVQ
jgi:hypothetical protein